MKRILAVVLIAVMLLAGCQVPDFTSSQVSENVSSEIVTSQTETSSSSTSSPDITVVTPPTNIGTENVISGEELPTSALPLTTNTWCYDQITEEQQRIYKILFSAANRMTYGWIDLGYCDVKNYNADIAVAYRAFTYDYPELFWMPYEYVVKREEKRVSVAFSINEAGMNQGYLVNFSTKKKMQEELDSATENFLKEVKANAKTPMEQLTFINDKLCNDITYYGTEHENDLVYTVYGALVAGYAVCEGYARSMRYLCKQLGIDCLIVTGISKEEQHMWNLVRFEDEWYHIDATWNDTDGISIPMHTFFNLTDEEISKDHIIDLDYSEVIKNGSDLGEIGYNFGLPEANGKKYNYYEYYGVRFTDVLAVSQKISEIYKTQNYLEMCLSESAQARYESDISSFFGALIANVRMITGEKEFKIKLYASMENSLYLEW